MSVERTWRNVGRQTLVRFGPNFSTVPGGQEGALQVTGGGVPLLGLTLAAAGTYTILIDTAGLGKIELHMKVSAVTGSCPIAFAATYADGSTVKIASTPAGGNLAANTQQDLVIAGLYGVKQCKITITIPGGGSAGPFTVAEFNGSSSET